MNFSFTQSNNPNWPGGQTTGAASESAGGAVGAWSTLVNLIYKLGGGPTPFTSEDAARVFGPAIAALGKMSPIRSASAEPAFIYQQGTSAPVMPTADQVQAGKDELARVLARLPPEKRAALAGVLARLAPLVAKWGPALQTAYYAAVSAVAAVKAGRDLTQAAMDLYFQYDPNAAPEIYRPKMPGAFPYVLPDAMQNPDVFIPEIPTVRGPEPTPRPAPAGIPAGSTAPAPAGGTTVLVLPPAPAPATPPVAVPPKSVMDELLKGAKDYVTGALQAAALAKLQSTQFAQLASLIPKTQPTGQVAAQAAPFAFVSGAPLAAPASKTSTATSSSSSCECTGSRAPKRKKGECGQGYFREIPGRDATQFTYWSHRKCP